MAAIIKRTAPYGVANREPLEYIGTDAERIAKPSGELANGDMWYVKSGTTIVAMYMWDGTDWDRWNV